MDERVCYLCASDERGCCFMCIWWGCVCVFFIGSRAGWAKISNFVFSLQNLLCPSRAQYVFKHIHTCSYIFIYNPMIEFPLASPIIDISFILIIEWLFWQIAASLTIECVLLLQNVFSCYRMCSLTIICTYHRVTILADCSKRMRGSRSSTSRQRCVYV